MGEVHRLPARQVSFVRPGDRGTSDDEGFPAMGARFGASY